MSRGLGAAPSSVDLSAESLRRQILSGEVTPGQILSEVGLAAELGVSRPTIREAMQTLAQEGYISREYRRRARVSTVTPDSLRELAQIRVPLELIAVRSFLARYDLAAGAMLNARVADMRRAVEEGDVLQVHATHVALHELFYSLSGNAILNRMWSGVMRPQVNLALAADLRARPDLTRMAIAHEDFVRALTGSPTAIETAVTAHVLGNVEETVPLLP